MYVEGLVEKLEENLVEGLFNTEFTENHRGPRRDLIVKYTLLEAS